MTMRSCLVCGTPFANLCPSCKTASYCSGEHQKKVGDFLKGSRLSFFFFTFRAYLQDWQSHEEYCLKVKAAGTNTFDAILFAVDETKPRLVKIPWKLVPGRGEDKKPGPYHELDTDVWFKHIDKDVKHIMFFDPDLLLTTDSAKARELPRLCILYDEKSTRNGLTINRCIVNATEGRAAPGPGDRPVWCGNILGLRMDKDHAFASVKMEEDLRGFLTYFEETSKA